MRLYTKYRGVATRVRAASTAQKALLSLLHSEASINEVSTQRLLHARQNHSFKTRSASTSIASLSLAHVRRVTYTQQPVYMAQQVQAKQRELQSKLEAMLASVEDERLRPCASRASSRWRSAAISPTIAYQQCLQKAQLPEQRASQVVQGS